MATVAEETCKAPARGRCALQGLLFDASEPPGRVTALTLARGERDDFAPASDQDALPARIPGAELKIYEGRARPAREERERFAADVAAFASRLT